MLIMIILGAAAMAALFYYKAIRPLSYWKNRGVKQGNPMWFFGDNWGQISGKQSIPDVVQHFYDMCPGTRYSGAYQFASMPTLILKDPDVIKEITVKAFDHFIDHRQFISSDADPLWAKNLFALEGQKWREMRNILSPSFTSSKMKSMFLLMTECSESFIQHFLQKDEELVTVEFKDAFTRFTNDVIATAAFGIKVDSLAKPTNEFYLMGKNAVNFDGFWKITKFIGLFLFPAIFKWFDVGFFTKDVGLFFRGLINETIKTREEKGIVRPDMINLLLEARKGVISHEDNGVIDTGFATALESDTVIGKHAKDITNEDITAQALIFFFAGFDSVSGLMCFSSYELAVHQDFQKRLRKEIQDTFAQCGGKLTYEALLKMKYMDMFTSETLRKWPNAVVIDRVCKKPYTIEPVTPYEKPLNVEEGTLIWLPVWAIHHDPEYYPDPERFDPERFNDENKGNINPYTYLPFGLGPRNCIGSRFALLETKIVLFYVLLNFEIVPIQKTIIPLKLDRKALINLRAEGGLWCGLKRIKQ